MKTELLAYRVKLRHYHYTEKRDELNRRNILSKSSVYIMETVGKGRIEREQWVREIENIAKKYGKLQQLKNYIDYVVNDVYKYLVVGKNNIIYRAYEMYVDKGGCIILEQLIKQWLGQEVLLLDLDNILSPGDFNSIFSGDTAGYINDGNFVYFVDNKEYIFYFDVLDETTDPLDTRVVITKIEEI